MADLDYAGQHPMSLIVQPAGLSVSAWSELRGGRITLLTKVRARRDAPGLAYRGLILGIARTLAANAAYGIHFGPVGALVNAWPAAAFITATEIFVGQMRRAGGISAPEMVGRTLADNVPRGVPAGVPEIAPVAVAASTVPPAPVATARTVASGRARGRASGRASKAPERIFAAEISRGQVPSLSAIKTRAKCGADRARTIRDQLAEILQEAPEAA